MQYIDSLDRQILSLISDNARMPFLEVARVCQVSGAAIQQRVQKLTNMGVIKGSQFVLDPKEIGYGTCAFIGIFLKDPSDFDRVTDELGKIPEVVECHYTTGDYDLFINADYAKSLGEERCKEEILNAAIALKLSMNLYELVKK